MKILTLNAGSNSLKFEIVETEPTASSSAAELFGKSLVAGVYENIGKSSSSFALLEGKKPRGQQQIQIRDHGHATQLLLERLERNDFAQKGVKSLSGIDRIGHRIVHGADLFPSHVPITDEVIRQIESLEDLAPLHNAPALRVIHACRNVPGTAPRMFAVFDTVFHHSIPDVAALYPLPSELSKKHRIRRYGFHGISHKYMMLRYGQITNRKIEETNVITAHLEGGSSVAAIKGGRSIDTSMGFTPLEGLMMATRCGDIDPALVTYLMRKESLTADKVEALLNKQSGLLGVSGLSPDTRELSEHLDQPSAKLSLQMFSYRVRKYIGAYLAALGGAEAIILGGGIGENTPIVREWISQDLNWCGAVFSSDRNANTVDREGQITTAESSVKVWIIPTQEGLMMANEVANCR